MAATISQISPDSGSWVIARIRPDEDVSDLLEGEVGVDAIGVPGLDVTLRQREMRAGGDVDGVDGDAVGGGDGWAGRALNAELDVPVRSANWVYLGR